MKFLLVSLFLASSFSAFAEDCTELTSTYDIKMCLDREITKEDKRLNANYAVVMKKLDKIGQEKLKKAQRAWIAFRDADCALSADEVRGGTMEGVIEMSCHLGETKERADMLKDLIKFR